MMWPFRRRNLHGLDAARRHLDSVKSRDDRVDQVAAESRKLTRQNHFAQKFQQAMEGR